MLAHELTHVAQQHGDDTIPNRIAPADSPAELEADRAAASPTSISHTEEDAIHRYRKKNAFNFPGVFEELLEEEFTDSATQPWIETINVVFDSTFVNGEGRHVPLGNLTANYHASKLPAIEFKISGGDPKFDLTSITTGNKIDRIEGHGYNDRPFAEGKGEGPKNKYAKEDPVTGKKFASMHYALFFKAGQAVHLGDLAIGSHACVHADPAKERRMAQLNFHSVKGLTTVTTSYDAVTQFVSCCDLFQHRGITKKGEAKNPCHDSDPGWCPHLWW